MLPGPSRTPIFSTASVRSPLITLPSLAPTSVSSSMASSSTSSSPSNKRPRNNSQSSSQSAQQPPGPLVVQRFSSFFNDPSADMLISSGDDRLFATKQADVVAASPELEEKLLIQTAGINRNHVRFEGQAAPGVLPVVNVPQSGDLIELLLRWSHQRTLKAVRDEFYALHQDETFSRVVLSLFDLASKYRMIMLPPQLVQSLRWPAGPIGYLDQVAIGVIHDMPSVVEAALLAWARKFENRNLEPPAVTDENADLESWNPRLNYVHLRWRVEDVADISRELYALLPRGFPRALALVRRNMMHRVENHSAETDATNFLAAMKAGFNR